MCHPCSSPKALCHVYGKDGNNCKIISDSGIHINTWSFKFRQMIWRYWAWVPMGHKNKQILWPIGTCSQKHRFRWRNLNGHVFIYEPSLVELCQKQISCNFFWVQPQGSCTIATKHFVTWSYYMQRAYLPCVKDIIHWKHVTKIHHAHQAGYQNPVPFVLLILTWNAQVCMVKVWNVGHILTNYVLLYFCPFVTWL